MRSLFPRPPAGAAQPHEAPPGDRGISPIGSQPNPTGKLLAVTALGVGGLLFVFATWSHGPAKKSALSAPPPPRQTVPFEPVKPEAAPPKAEASAAVGAPTGPLIGLDGRPVPGSAPIVPSITGTPDQNAPGDPETAAAASQGGHVPTPKERALALLQSAERAPLTAFSAGVARAGAAAERLVAEEPELSRSAAGPQPQPTALEALRRGSAVQMASATRLPDRNTLLVAGTSLPCILQTAMDSAAPGYVTCLVPRDVYSDNGAVVLMPKGTRVLGEYASALRQGSTRLFVLWIRAVTPEGIAIKLSSPATDALGRAGFDGAIDTEFWTRFGSALLFSVVGDATTIASSHLASGEFNQTTNVPSQTAGIALSNSIAIPPVLRKNQGSEVSILLPEDLSFASVYSLRPLPAAGP